MAITERSLSDNTANSGTSSATTISVTPTGMQENDWLLFLLVSAGGTATHTNTAGSLSRLHAADVTQSNTCVVSTWKKKCGASEAGPYSFDVGGSNRRIAVACRAYIGGDATDIIESTAPLDGAAAQSFDIASMDPDGAGRWAILLEGVVVATAGVSITFTQPTDYIEDHEVSSAHANSSNAFLAYAHRELPSDAATGTLTWTISGGANRAGIGGGAILRPAVTAIPLVPPARRLLPYLAR